MIKQLKRRSTRGTESSQISNLHKYNKLASRSFANAIRLHRDSIILFNNGSVPTSFALSIIAQEELGKSFMLEEIVNQDDGTGIHPDGDYANVILKTMFSHKSKQGWFSYQVGDIFRFKYGSKKSSKIMKDIQTGKLDQDKQNALYVGLAKWRGKLILKMGKILDPVSVISTKQAESHITRVNDFVIEHIEMTLRGLGGSGNDEVISLLTTDLIKELEEIWPVKSPASQRRLKLTENMILTLS